MEKFSILNFYKKNSINLNIKIPRINIYLPKILGKILRRDFYYDRK